jgi:predicted methyltransferase
MGKRVESFQARLIRHLLKVLDGRSDPFISIVARARNCDPAFLMDTLSEMETRRLLQTAAEGSEKEYALTPHAEALSRGYYRCRAPVQIENSGPASRSLLESHYFTDLVNAVRNSLPEPCLVYSQWWFSKPTYGRLVDLLFRLTRKDARVAFVGASTLAAVFSQCAPSPTTIIDVDEILLRKIASCATEAAQMMCRDISCPLDTSLRGKFDLVVSDPPWSRSSLRTFFLRSAELLAPAATLVISFPPVFTRPSVRVERRGLLRTAETIGLSLAGNLPDHRV